MQDYSDILSLKKGYVEKLKELEVAVSQLKEYYTEVAELERYYREAKSKAYTTLLAEDQKITVIPVLAAGKTTKIRLDFKIAEGILKSARENIKRLHSNIEAYRTLISIAKSEINLR